MNSKHFCKSYYIVKYTIAIVSFTWFVSSIFCDFFKSTGQNRTKRTLLERIFNVASDDVISADNNS